MNSVRKLLGTGPSNEPVPLPLKSSNGPTWPPSDLPDGPLSPTTSLSPKSSMRGYNSPASAIPRSLESYRQPSTPGAAPDSSLLPATPSTSTSKRFSANKPLNTRDELLISLLASEAVVDSREYDILDAEQVDELKKEYQQLHSRSEALVKKLALETKIRDAALSLSRVNSQSRPKTTPSKKSVSFSPSIPSSPSGSPEQLEAANARVERTQRDLTRVTERMHEVHKMLMEHRAGVLSFSVRNLEKKMSVASGYSDDSGYDSSKSNRSTLMSPATPSSSTPYSNGILNGLMSPKSRFDGAHLFAGHADAIVPKPRLSPEAAATSISNLESRLKEAQEALVAAGKKQAEMGRELAMMKLEKQEVETTLSMELQTAEEQIEKLREEVEDTAEKVKNENQSKQDKQQKEEDRERERETMAQRERELEERFEEERQRLKEEHDRRLEGLERELETERQKWEEKEKEFAELKEDKDDEIKRLKTFIDNMQSHFEEERRIWEDEKLEDMARLQEEMEAAQSQSQSSMSDAESQANTQAQTNAQLNEELDAGLISVQQMVKAHGIVLFSRDSSLQGLLNAISVHLDSVHKNLESYSKAEADWDTLRRKLEEDIRIGMDRRETMARDLEDARRERDVAFAQATASLSNLNAINNEASAMAPKRDTLSRSVNNNSSASASGSVDDDVLAILQPLWAILPSPEARAAKFSAGRSFRTGSPTPNSPTAANPSSGGVATSLSDLDVRSLKALYNSTMSSTRNATSSPTPFSPGPPTPFSLPAFAARVQALINDDKALIERLLRFAQAHDLLKKNAERAQKLAQDGTHALETYQKQVRTLEERQQAAWGKVAALQEELHLVHDALERVTAEKHDLEAQAAEQAETCRQLTEANNSLSARTLTLADEAAQAPVQVRRHLEGQLQEMQAKLQAELKEAQSKLNEVLKREEETRKKLNEAQEEVVMMRDSEQSQKIALLDELNSMQTENGNLRAQLRALKA